MAVFQIELPDSALLLLIGPSGAGKSTFAARHFQPTEIISSDHCRALICDDEAAQHLNAEAFGLVHHLARLRLQQNKLTVIDATNLEYRARRPFLRLARRCGVPVIALVFEVALATCQARNQSRSTRVVPSAVVQKQALELTKTATRLEREGYAGIYRLNESNLAAATIVRVRNWVAS
ncbi:MAG: AAA family ATPase [Acidobacteria bacterium]|nr:AAA family ATPase [Acidobacteriota bacterium]MBI3426590.1 AAA family ATPase [Acidobacteriota bacterium]